jgi:hypothetical protein
MSDINIPFTLEQETKYRRIISFLFDAADCKKYSAQAGVLTNMLIFEMVKQANQTSPDFFEHCPEWIEAHADFDFFNAHIPIWLEDKEFKNVRFEIERREKLITGKVSNSARPLTALSQRIESQKEIIRSKLSNIDGFDSSRDFTREEILQFLDAERSGNMELFLKKILPKNKK